MKKLSLFEKVIFFTSIFVVIGMFAFDWVMIDKCHPNQHIGWRCYKVTYERIK